MRNSVVVFSFLLLTTGSCSVPRQIAPASPGTVWMYKYTGAVQCGVKGVPLDVMEKELTTNGIEVLSSCRASDGLFRVSVCGVPAGSINAYEIDAHRLQEAVRLGFAEVNKLPGYQGRPIEKMFGEECSKRQS